MKTCEKCGCRLDDDAKFCKECGAECVDKRKKMSYAERRDAKARETAAILDKASLKPEELDGKKLLTLEHLSVKRLGEAKKIFIRNVVIVSAMILIIALALVLFFVLKSVEFNPNVKLLIVLLAFVGGACAAAVVLERIYYLRMLRKMEKSEFAIKKVFYGKPPVFCRDGFLYSVAVRSDCPFCSAPSAMHIEEVAGKFAVVCDRNRTHLMVVDTAMMKACFDAETIRFDTEKEALLYAEQASAAAASPQESFTVDQAAPSEETNPDGDPPQNMRD